MLADRVRRQPRCASRPAVAPSIADRSAEADPPPQRTGRVRVNWTERYAGFVRALVDRENGRRVALPGRPLPWLYERAVHALVLGAPQVLRGGKPLEAQATAARKVYARDPEAAAQAVWARLREMREAAAGPWGGTKG